jgi:hypothetical protein
VARVFQPYGNTKRVWPPIREGELGKIQKGKTSAPNRARSSVLLGSSLGEKLEATSSDLDRRRCGRLRRRLYRGRGAAPIHRLAQPISPRSKPPACAGQRRLHGIEFSEELLVCGWINPSKKSLNPVVAF